MEGGGIEGKLLTSGAVRKRFEKRCTTQYSVMYLFPNYHCLVKGINRHLKG